MYQYEASLCQIDFILVKLPYVYNLNGFKYRHDSVEPFGEAQAARLVDAGRGRTHTVALQDIRQPGQTGQPDGPDPLVRQHAHAARHQDGQRQHEAPPVRVRERPGCVLQIHVRGEHAASDGRGGVPHHSRQTRLPAQSAAHALQGGRCQRQAAHLVHIRLRLVDQLRERHAHGLHPIGRRTHHCQGIKHTLTYANDKTLFFSSEAN